MKRILSLMLVLAMVFSFTACQGGTQPQADASASAAAETSAADVSAADTSGDESAPAEPQVETGDPAVRLEQVEDAVLADDGTVLVNFEYQRAAVTLPNAEAMTAIQADLDAELQEFLDYVSGELTASAKDALSYSQEMDGAASDSFVYEFQPYYGQYVLTASRVDERVVSLVVDSIGYSGGAHGWDNRYCLNYDAQTGQRLSFAMLGKDFRETAEKLVLAKAEESKDQLDEDYANQIPLVVADGTESADEVNRRVYPDLYADASMETETGNVTAQYYFNDKGLLFIAGQYVMKPYAGGILEFGVSYKRFGDAINTKYLPKEVEEQMAKEKAEAEKKAAAKKAEAEKKAAAKKAEAEKKAAAEEKESAKAE